MPTPPTHTLPQAAKLLAAFKEFKRREAVGLVPFYAHKLTALEQAMLETREKMFTLTVRWVGGAQAFRGSHDGPDPDPISQIQIQVHVSSSRSRSMFTDPFCIGRSYLLSCS